MFETDHKISGRILTSIVTLINVKGLFKRKKPIYVVSIFKGRDGWCVEAQTNIHLSKKEVIEVVKRFDSNSKVSYYEELYDYY